MSGVCSGVQKVLDAQGQQSSWMPTSPNKCFYKFISKNFWQLLFSPFSQILTLFLYSLVGCLQAVCHWGVWTRTTPTLSMPMCEMPSGEATGHHIKFTSLFNSTLLISLSRSKRGATFPRSPDVTFRSFPIASFQTFPRMLGGIPFHHRSCVRFEAFLHHRDTIYVELSSSVFH